MRKIGVVFDIDGVITDGKVYINDVGKEMKSVNMKDIDAIFELHRRGYPLAAITCENSPFTEYVKTRFPWSFFFSNVKDKGNIIEKIRSEGLEYIVYVGDGIKDISAFLKSNFRVCPEDAIPNVKELANYTLKNVAGSGGLWELIDVCESLNRNMPNTDGLWKTILNKHLLLIDSIMNDTIYNENVVLAAKIISQAYKNKNKVLIFGNGGSAADAQHIAAEFVSRFKREREPFACEALTVNTSILTAISNDYSFEKVFSRQLESSLCEGDVAIGISTSGKSQNVIEALNLAAKKGGKTILLTGQHNSDLFQYDVVLCVPSSDTARIQEVHILTGHYWAEYVEDNLISY